MLRNDGDFDIYVLQHKYQKKGKWTHSGEGGSFAANISARYRHNYNDSNQYIGSKYPFDEFTASGDCWQWLGIHGTFKSEAAICFLQEIARHNPLHSFRIVKVRLVQHTEQIAEASYSEGYKAGEV